MIHHTEPPLSSEPDERKKENSVLLIPGISSNYQISPGYLVGDKFFDELLKSTYFKEKLRTLKLQMFNDFGKVCEKFYEAQSNVFDITEFLYSLPAEKKRNFQNFQFNTPT